MIISHIIFTVIDSFYSTIMFCQLSLYSRYFFSNSSFGVRGMLRDWSFSRRRASTGSVLSPDAICSSSIIYPYHLVWSRHTVTSHQRNSCLWRNHLIDTHQPSVENILSAVSKSSRSMDISISSRHVSCIFPCFIQIFAPEVPLWILRSCGQSRYRVSWSSSRTKEACSWKKSRR